MEHDQPTTAIAEFAAGLAERELRDETHHAVVRLHLDATGCALGALYEGPSQIAREVARTATNDEGCSVFGLERRVAPEQAVFANTTMVRQLDFNDSLGGDSATGGGHPSDMIPAVIAAGELCGSSGAEAVRAIYLAYEVFAALEHTYALAPAGFDHAGPFTAVGAALGAGYLMGCDAERFANALSIALTPAMALVVARKGELSNWKGCAAAHGAMTGLFAARLAARGMTGPKAPFAGSGGLDEQVAPRGPLEIGVAAAGASAVERSGVKYYPAVIYSQGLIEVFIALGREHRAEEVEAISIETFEVAWRNAGGGGGEADHEEKWHPSTRETADHSLAYLLAVAFLDGEVTARSFSPERLSDRATAALMARISVAPAADLTASFPDEHRSRVALRLADGTLLETAARDPLGSRRNPMSDEQLATKFRRLASEVLAEEAVDALESVLWRLGELDDLSELTAHLRRLR